MKVTFRLGVIFSLTILSAIVLPVLAKSRGSLLSSQSTSTIPQNNRNSTLASAKISFESCSPSSSWLRPSITEQTQQLQSLPRYAGRLDTEPFKNLSANFWNHKIFSFTSYGLSSRFEPIYFSGLWTIIDPLLNCYDLSVIEQLNTGQMAEVWLLSYQALTLEWLDGVYVVVVEPKSQGVEMMRFIRQEKLSSLPVKVMTTDGQEISIVSLDSTQ